MYFAIRDTGKIALKEIGGNIENSLETYNEMKIIKTKVNKETKVYILIFEEITNAKSLIMAHGGRYLEEKLIISDNVDSREYSLKGTLHTINIHGNKEEVEFKADRCRFVEFPLIEELIKLNSCEITQFISCIEIIKNNEGDYLEFTKINN